MVRAAIAVLLFLISFVPARADEPLPGFATMKLLFCASGSVGLQPVPAPRGFENQFADAVVDVIGFLN